MALYLVLMRKDSLIELYMYMGIEENNKAIKNKIIIKKIVFINGISQKSPKQSPTNSTCNSVKLYPFPLTLKSRDRLK